MALTLAQAIARLTRDLYPGVWQQERMVIPARSDVLIPHIMGRVPDLVEIGDPPLLDELQGPSVEDASSVPWSKWFNLNDLEVTALAAALLRPTGHPIVEIIEVTDSYIVVRNWFVIDQDVGILVMVRQPRARINVEDDEGMFGVWIDFSADDTDVATGVAVNFTDISTYTDSMVGAAWDWDWGDGTPHGNTQNPAHAYAAPGNYDVTMTVTMADTTTIIARVKLGYITVT